MMVRLSTERILLIGDAQQDVGGALARAVPDAQITAVPSVFDGIAELSSGSFTAVFTAIEPIERRPDAAVRTLRELAGGGRLVLFGHPTLEVLARKMLEFGCDDYIITPANPSEIQQLLGKVSMRLASAAAIAPGDILSSGPAQAPAAIDAFAQLPLDEIFLDALLNCPHEGASLAVEQINRRVGPRYELHFAKPQQAAPQLEDGRIAVAEAVRCESKEAGTLYLLVPPDEDPSAAQIALARIAPSIGKTIALQERHNRLQKLAITDELTGLYNNRYFRHFLARTIERAKTQRFPVTLLLFDIDNFKKYNDQFGHSMGDEILRQSAALMRRCCREHDLVARVGGDEFAVVFWDKEGPRQPLDPAKPVGPSRPPQEPMQIFERFRKLAASEDFSGLGSSGRGQLSVSGGLAVFPYDAVDMESLIQRADEHLMFHAKKAGKNSIYLVDGQQEAAGR